MKYFNFLISDLNFKLEEVDNIGYSLYAKFISNDVGIYFLFEFRDCIPRIQISKLGLDGLNERAGLYTLKELYKDKNFNLQSFYLDEIVSYKVQKDYKSYFQGIKTIEDSVRVSAELLEIYALDFVKGNDGCFSEMNQWFRKEISKYYL